MLGRPMRSGVIHKTRPAGLSVPAMLQEPAHLFLQRHEGRCTCYRTAPMAESIHAVVVEGHAGTPGHSML